MDKVEPCIYVAPATKFRPAGYKVVKFVTDQFGDRRCIQEIFRGRDALDRARRCRDEIESDKRRQRYYKPPVKKVDKEKALLRQLQEGSFDALFELGALAREGVEKPKDTAVVTLKEYIELGLRRDLDDNLSIDPNNQDRGYLRRVMEETGINNQNQKLGIWATIQDWGGIHKLPLSAIKGETVDDFVRYLEMVTNKNGTPYATATIRRYRMELMSMVKGFAAHQGLVNPLDQSPPLKKPSRIKGEDETVKVPTQNEVDALEKGFEKILTKTTARYYPQKQWTWHVHQVLRDTGCRPGEILALAERSIDREALTLTISHAVSHGDVGLTKTGKAKGSRKEGTRIVPISKETLAVIDNWITLKSSLMYQKSEWIFANQDGNPAGDDDLRKHYKATGSPITPYQMRHWRNDQLRRMGAPVEVRKAVMGHMSDEINANYTNVDPEELRKYVDRPHRQ